MRRRRREKRRRRRRRSGILDQHQVVLQRKWRARKT